MLHRAAQIQIAKLEGNATILLLMQMGAKPGDTSSEIILDSTKSLETFRPQQSMDP